MTLQRYIVVTELYDSANCHESGAFKSWSVSSTTLLNRMPFSLLESLTLTSSEESNDIRMSHVDQLEVSLAPALD